MARVYGKEPKQVMRCRWKRCWFAGRGNEPYANVRACWPDGVIGRKGAPAPVVMSMLPEVKIRRKVA